MCCAYNALPLFLASTVSALHRNAHIWSASHSLLVNYYCWVTVYSPSMEGQKKITYRGLTPGVKPGSRMSTKHWSAIYAIRSIVPTWSYWIRHQWRFIERSNHNFCWERKNSVDTKNNESFIYMLLKLYCKSNPVWLIQQWSVIFLLASYVQWHYFLVWAYEN